MIFSIMGDGNCNGDNCNDSDGVDPSWYSYVSICIVFLLSAVSFSVINFCS